jgi:beta-glucosidase
MMNNRTDLESTQFPEDFVWGAATASYQVEGGKDAEGKGESVWDMFCRKPGAIRNGDTGDEGSAHFSRWQEDLLHMSTIGLKGYRFSISWPRVMPEGIGTANDAGIAFYDRLVDGLLAAGIEPWVTLFHWDYPLALYYRGGWLNPESPRWFADYTQVIVDRLSDRVRHWITLNEPQCFVELGHHEGVHAPGLQLPLRETLRVAHHVLLAHGLCVETIRSRAKRTPQIGWAPVGYGAIPVSESPSDIQAARLVTFDVHEKRLWNTSWWSDAALLGHYPEAGLRQYGEDVPDHPSSDWKIIRQPLDFLGANLYNAQVFGADRSGNPVKIQRHAGYPESTYEWKVEPEAMRWVPKFYYERYRLPIVITENGTATTDWVTLDGQIPDGTRIDFLQRYLLELRRAMHDGVPVRGYFHWSLMDNFEWNQGYRIRMGLIHVDYPTGRRRLKASARWFRQVIDSNGAFLRRSAAGP